MSDYKKGDILTITTKSYSGRKFTVVESNGHRSVLRGTRGSRRVLVVRTGLFSGGKLASNAYGHLHEDDGEKNRGRPCSVDQIEQAESAPGRPLSDLGAGDIDREFIVRGPRGGETRARFIGWDGGEYYWLDPELTGGHWTIDQDGWTAEDVGERATIAAPAPERPRHRPITAMELAMLMRCDTPREVAEWVIQRDVTQAMVTRDQHAADNGAAMKLYLSSLEIRRVSEGMTADEDG